MRILQRTESDPVTWASPALSTMWPLDLRRLDWARIALTATGARITDLLSRDWFASSGLPSVWSGRRRRHLTLLALAGVGQATAAGVGASSFSSALASPGASTHGWLFGVLLSAAVTVGLLRMAARVLAERLSQDYVHEIRLDLVRRSLFEGRHTPLSVAVARSTSDLTSVSCWVSQGVAPLAVGIPLFLGVGAALALLDPLLSVGMVVPMAVLVAAMRVLAPVVDQRTRMVRRQRGRLSAQVSDTLRSTAAVRAAGGAERELQLIDTYSRSLVAASTARAMVAGAMGGVTAAMSGIAMSVVIGIGVLARLPVHSIAGALVVVGFLATPLYDVGRTIEYRQTYRAARRALGPVIERPVDSVLEPIVSAKAPSGQVGGAVVAAYLELSDGTTMPELVAGPGWRIVVDAGSERLTSEVLERFVSLCEGRAGEIIVGGKNLAVSGPKDFRALVGYAARGMALRRGSVSQTVRYHCPDSEPDEVGRMLAAVDLTDRIASLIHGADTILVGGGDPLTVPERARLLLAGAMLDGPPLLVFDHLDADLEMSGCTMMRGLLADYPGVVILASDDPEQVVTPTHVWRPDGLERVGPGTGSGAGPGAGSGAGPGAGSGAEPWPGQPR